MKLTSNAIRDGEMIPDAYAFNVPDDSGKGTFGPNLNPDFSWEDLPEGTESLVLICHDPDAPASGELVNQDGKEIPEDFPRADFVHWVLVEISPDSTGIVEGAFSNGIVEGGKDDLHSAQNTRQGLNDYTNWFAGHSTMEGQYVGYDGPCPPWNDARIHRYHFTLYALDIDELDVGYWFTADTLMEEIEDSVLATARLTGLYTLNPALRDDA